MEVKEETSDGIVKYTVKTFSEVIKIAKAAKKNGFRVTAKVPSYWNK